MSEEQNTEVAEATETTAVAEETTEAKRQPKDPSEMSRTDRFKLLLQANYGEILGTKISRDKAWALFKESMDSVVQQLLEDEEHRLPLAGVGTFDIRMSKPRAPVGGGKSRFEGIEEIPHFKFKASDRYRSFLFEHFGIKPADAKEGEAAE